MKILVTVIILLITSSVSGQKFIDVDPLRGPDRLLKLSEVAAGVEYIKLETIDSCLISNVIKVVSDDSFIFISSPFKDDTRLLMFSKSGKFIMGIGLIGRGPGEYASVLDFTINFEEEIIYILDPFGKILQYSFTGKYLKTIKLDARPARIAFYNSNIWLFSAWPDYYLNNGYAIQVISVSKSAPEKFLLNRKWVSVKRNPNSYVYPNFHFSVNSRNSISFFEEKFDTLYYIDSQGKFNSEYVVKLKNDMPLYFETHSEFNQQIKKHNLLFDFIETKDYLLFSVMAPTPATKYFFAVSKKTGEVFKHDMTKDKQQFINDIDYGPPFNPRGYASDNVLYSTIDSYKLKEFLESHSKRSEYNPKQSNLKQIEGLVSKSDYSDNPVIILTKLK